MDDGSPKDGGDTEKSDDIFMRLELSNFWAGVVLTLVFVLVIGYAIQNKPDYSRPRTEEYTMTCDIYSVCDYVESVGCLGVTGCGKTYSCFRDFRNCTVRGNEQVSPDWQLADSMRLINFVLHNDTSGYHESQLDDYMLSDDNASFNNNPSGVYSFAGPTNPVIADNLGYKLMRGDCHSVPCPNTTHCDKWGNCYENMPACFICNDTAY